MLTGTRRGPTRRDGRALASLAAGLLLAACQPSTAEPRGCTQLWCSEGLTVAFGDAPWAPGAYRIEVLVDDRRTTCRARLPMTNCSAPASTCDDPSVRLLPSGCALAPDAQGFHGLHLAEVPERIHLRLEGPGGHAEVRSPVQRQCSFPNGRACDLRLCCGAQITTHLQWRR